MKDDIGKAEIAAFVGQKGGTGKSTMAQGFAVQLALVDGKQVMIADMDSGQYTSSKWSERRIAFGHTPDIPTRPILSAAAIEGLRELCEVLVVDTAGGSNAETLAVAREANMIVLPTGTNEWELEPTTQLMEELLDAGIDPDKLVIALTKVRDLASEKAARDYIETAGVEYAKARGDANAKGSDEPNPAYSDMGLGLHDYKTTQGIGSEGLTAVEASNKAVKGQAHWFFGKLLGRWDVSRGFAKPRNKSRKQRDRELAARGGRG